MAVNMTIIGLGQIGASIGLALGKHKEHVKRSGIDREPLISERAIKRGAVDHLFRNLQASVEGADVVVMAVPPDEVRETMEIIAPALKEGVVVLDSSPLQQTAIRWAKELFSGERHFVCISPSLNPIYLHETGTGIDVSHDDLFKNGVMAISAGVGTHGDALKLAADLASMLEAKVYFADPLEVDGLVAGSELLSSISSTALILAATDQPGWSEGRKLASRAFALASTPAALLEGKKSLGQTMLLNRESTLRVLDNFIAILQSLREAIADNDQASLHSLVERAQTKRQEWWKQRQAGDWEIRTQTEIPTMGEVLGRFIGLGGKKKRKE